MGVWSGVYVVFDGDFSSVTVIVSFLSVFLVVFIIFSLFFLFYFLCSVSFLFFILVVLWCSCC
jgi:hypothetical protein